MQAYENLRDAGRCNILYLLAKAVGTMREDGRDTLSPMGLLVSFFTATSVNQVNYMSCIRG